jgi:gluconokinase
MAHIPGLRSPYEKVGRLVYFGRMLDKIRLHAKGLLPAEYVANLGDDKGAVFDTRCCGFLRVPFAEVSPRTLEGGSDDEILQWAEGRGGRRTDEECLIWNGFMMKRGWHDPAEIGARLRQRIVESGLQGKTVETFFDFIDFDEGRDPAAARSWQKV